MEVSKDALVHNVRALRKTVAPLQFMAVLKANGYGFGVDALAEVLADEVDAFGVAELEVALRLKVYQKPVHVLGAVIDEEVARLVEADVIAPITDVRIARIINEEAQRQGKKALTQLVIDSGMGRLGILAEEFASLIPELQSLTHLNIQGLYSHFPVAYEDKDFSRDQIELVSDVCSLLRAAGFSLPCIHIANSDGIQNIDEALRSPFTMARSGINIHGIYDHLGDRRVALKETFRLKTRLVSVRKLPAGKSIGYGREYRTSGEELIGTIPAGYADGIPFKWKDGFSVRIKGVPCPLVGRVSMDYTTILLDEVLDPRVGDEVICLGDGISVYDWAHARGTIPYEVVCSIGSRVERLFVESFS